MKILICPLVSRDMKKAQRAVETSLNLYEFPGFQFDCVPIINSKNQQFIDEFSSWCKKNSIIFEITESNGTPSKGKNSCIDFFKSTQYDGLCMLDGDDMFYPTASIQIARHLQHHPYTDIIIVKPSDQISNKPDNANLIRNNVYACCWGTHFVEMPFKAGVSQHEMFQDRNKASNLGGHVFYSQKACKYLKYDESQLLGEDLLLEFEMLKLHQEAKISFWLSFASDVQLLDRTDNNSNIQSEYNKEKGDYYYNELLEKVKNILDIKRSSFNELPIEFPPLFFSHQDKLNFINDLIVKYD